MFTEDPDSLLATLVRMVESGTMPMSEASDQEIVATTLYKAITPFITIS